MHDYTLISIEVDWKSGDVKMTFLDAGSATKLIKAQGISSLTVPRTNEWGPSVSVLQVNAIESIDNGLFRLRVEMQSGDVIELIAQNVVMPTAS